MRVFLNRCLFLDHYFLGREKSSLLLDLREEDGDDIF